jgi:tetratricopeptide (TPR) repeat protein
MRYWYTLVCLVLIVSLKAESLQDEDTFKNLYDKALSHKITHPNLSLQLLDSLITLSKDEQDIRYRIKSQILKSEILKVEGRYDEALKGIWQASLLAKQYSAIEFEGSIYLTTGFIYKERNSDSSRFYYELALGFFENLQDSTEMAKTLTRMAHLYMDHGKFTRAMQYLNKAERLIRKDDYLGQLNVLTNKAHAYSSVGLETSSITASRNAVALIHKHKITKSAFNLSAVYGNICNSYLNVGQADSAYYFAVASVTSLDSISARSPFLVSLGNIYLALDSATQALKIFNKLDVHKSTPEYYFLKLEGLFKSYLELGEPSMARKIALETIKNVPADVPRKKGWMKIYQIAEVAAAYLNEKELVYAYQKNHFDFYREIYNQENLSTILQMDFDDRLEDEKIKSQLGAALLKTELKYNQLRQWGLLIGAIFLIIILFLMFIRYRSQQRFNKLLREKVSERTLELAIKNEQLSEYAFINAHKLRAPVARIMGLVSIYELKENTISTEKLVGMLKYEIQTLDQIVRSISEAVKERKSFTREDVNDSHRASI